MHHKYHVTQDIFVAIHGLSARKINVKMVYKFVGVVFRYTDNKSHQFYAT